MNEKDQRAVINLVMNLEIEIKTILNEFEERLEALEKKEKLKEKEK